MRLIDELRAEHDLIERVAGSFRTLARQRARGEGVPEDGPRFLAFFRLYAGQFHHAREEDTLFIALQRDAELPGDRGPIAALLEDHHRMAGLLDQMEPVAAATSAEARASLEAIALEYSQQLWQHIDAENSVLLPESEARLRRHGVRELPSQEVTRVCIENRSEGSFPVESPKVVRGVQQIHEFRDV